MTSWWVSKLAVWWSVCVCVLCLFVVHGTSHAQAVVE